MKAPFRKRTTARRFSLILILSLTVTVWTFSASAAREPTGGSAKHAAPPSASALDAQKIPPSQRVKGQAAVRQQATKTNAVRTAPAAVAVRGAVKNCSPECSVLKRKLSESLMSANFTFIPVKALDPFVPFVSLETSAEVSLPQAVDPQGPLTPLQRMTLSEIQRGLTAITWGQLGRRAVIEDATGRGYIVKVGTPAGTDGGVITQILDNSIVIQQDIWNNKARKRLPRNFTIRLLKKNSDGA